MTDKDGGNLDSKCVECDRPTTHAGAYFCEDCAPEFYNEREGD